MKSQEFQALAEQLGELSEAQRSALLAALRSKGSTNEALAMIETRFAADPCCGHCGSKRVPLAPPLSGERQGQASITTDRYRRG